VDLLCHAGLPARLTAGLSSIFLRSENDSGQAGMTENSKRSILYKDFIYTTYGRTPY